MKTLEKLSQEGGRIVIKKVGEYFVGSLFRKDSYLEVSSKRESFEGFVKTFEEILATKFPDLKNEKANSFIFENLNCKDSNKKAEISFSYKPDEKEYSIKLFFEGNVNIIERKSKFSFQDSYNNLLN